MMKKSVFMLIAFLSTLSVFGQDQEIETLSQVRHNGFYVGLHFKASPIENEIAPMIGGKVAWTINRIVALGMEGNALLPTVILANLVPPDRIRPLMGYGGFFVEPIFFSNKLIHLTTPVSFGSGWAGYIYDWNGSRNADLLEQQIFWYVEPAANLELNLSRNMRLYLGASYRFTQDIKIFESNYQHFRGMNYQIGLKIGRF